MLRQRVGLVEWEGTRSWLVFGLFEVRHHCAIIVTDKVSFTTDVNVLKGVLHGRRKKLAK